MQAKRIGLNPTDNIMHSDEQRRSQNATLAYLHRNAKFNNIHDNSASDIFVANASFVVTMATKQQRLAMRIPVVFMIIGGQSLNSRQCGKVLPQRGADEPSWQANVSQ
jgi:hypothetical protein